jgi:hypothetical protein
MGDGLHLGHWKLNIFKQAFTTTNQKNSVASLIQLLSLYD